MKRRPCGYVVFFVAVGVCLGLCGCAIVRSTASAKGTAADTAFVRSVDFDQTPEMKDLAERARQIGNEVYPKILTLLADDTSKVPRQFNIVIKKHISSGAPGDTLGKRIRLNAAWLTNYPVYLDLVLSHEMAHVAQGYKWYRSSKIPFYWREGIADYARYKVGFTKGWGCPECSGEFPHYTSGWSCAGAFLLYLDKMYGSNVVRQLNAELRRGAYSDTFFTQGLDHRDHIRSTAAKGRLLYQFSVRNTWRCGCCWVIRPCACRLSTRTSPFDFDTVHWDHEPVWAIESAAGPQGFMGSMRH